MKRLVSTVLCICMLLSSVSGFGFSFAFAQTPGVADEYAPLFDSDSEVYANTLVIIPSLDASTESVTYTFSGISITESYDASRHFASYSDALAAWEARFSDSSVVTSVPNFILTAGTYDETVTVRYNANIYGAQAGIAPNDSAYDIDTALAADEWALTRTDDAAETVISGGILRSNVDGTVSDTNIKYETLMQQAGAESFNLNIDGVKFTASTAIGTMSEKYNVSGVKAYRTNIINVKNSIFSGNEYGISAENDASWNINEYTVTDCHITGISGAFVYKNPKKIHFDRVNYTLSEHIYNSSGMLWTNTGGDRNVDFTFKNSRFSNNIANQILQLYDNTYLPSFVVTFENNIMYDAWEKTYGGIYYKTFVDSSGQGRYNGPDFVFRDNIIMNTKNKYISVLNGNNTEQLAAYDIEFTGNRIIGYTSALPNTGAVMDAFLADCNWSVENNYFADTFESVDDVKGTAPVYWLTDASIDPANVKDAVYYLDYNMTLKSTDFLTGTSKEYTYFNINHADRVVRAVVDSSEVITDFGFTSGSESIGIVYTLYSDEALTTEVTSVDPSAFTNGTATYYVKAATETGSASVTYTLILFSSDVSGAFSEKYSDSTGTIVTSKAAALVEGSFTDGETVYLVWKGVVYTFTYGTDAFGTVADALAAGKTQIILPAGSYGNIDITGSAELYGEGFGINPNTKYSDSTKAWSANTAWSATGETKVKGNITVNITAAQANTVKIDGITMAGYFLDTKRPAASNKKTSIVIQNTKIAYEGAANPTFLINLTNSNSNNTNFKNINIDEFTLKNSRFDFGTDVSGTSTTVFGNYLPSKFTVDGVYFTQSFAYLGTPAWRETVASGKMTLTNNYFNGYSRATASMMQIRGLYQHASYGNVNRLDITNNIFVDCGAKSSNSSSNYVMDIYAGGFDNINVTGNTFIDTTNSKGMIFEISNSNYVSGMADLTDILTFENNRVIGFLQYLYLNGNTSAITNGEGNYYANYDAGYASGKNGLAMYGIFEGQDYYLDYDMTTKASDMQMNLAKEGSAVDHFSKTASIIVSGDYESDIYTKDGKARFLLYKDADCAQPIETVTQNGTYYAKATSLTGVSVVYKLCISKGNAAAPQADKYLVDTATGSMPYGTKYTKTFKGTEYLFTVGVNAFGSVSQVTSYHSAKGLEGVPEIILPAGVYQDDIKITGDVKLFGEEGTVLASEPDTQSPIKIAAVGDSITEGGGLDAEDRATDAYPAHLGNILDEQFGEGAYEVKNCGWGNSTVSVIDNSISSRFTYTHTAQYYAALDYNPDVVVIMLGLNDTDMSIFKSVENYRERYQALIDSFRSLPSHPTVIIASSTSRTASIRCETLTEAIIPVQKQLAEANGLIYIDMYSPTENKNWDTRYFYTDGLHYNSNGYNWIADLIKQGSDAIYTDSRTAELDTVEVDTSLKVVNKEHITVALVGDDYTYGTNNDTYYGQYLQDVLGRRYEVRSFGEPKATVDSYKESTRYQLSKDFDADYVVMLLGNNDTSDFTESYKTLAKEYVDAGAKVYALTYPSKAANAASANGYIKAAAEAVTGVTLVDTNALTAEWSTDMYSEDGVHFSDEGNRQFAYLVQDGALAVDFKDFYTDDLGEISDDAFLLDMTASAMGEGKALYHFEGGAYYFEWGVNLFNDINSIITKANELGITDIDVLIPENNIKTADKNVLSISSTETQNITSVEIYGDNRRFDPNDKSLSSSDPTAEWTLSEKWDSFARSGGTSAIGKFNISQGTANTVTGYILKGKLLIKGITFRDQFAINLRVGSDLDRDLASVIENCVFDYTSKSANQYLFQTNSNYRNHTNGNVDINDSLTVKNVRLETVTGSSATNLRLVTNGSIARLRFEGVYFDVAKNYIGTTQYTLGRSGYWITGSAVTTTKAEIIGCNFRNGYFDWRFAGANKAPASDKTVEFTVKDNVFYNAGSYKSNGAALCLFSGYYTSMTIENNYFVDPANLGYPIGVGDTTAYALEPASHSFKNNTFILSNTSKLVSPITAFTPDMTGAYVAAFEEGYSSKVAGIAPTVGTADYYYLDFMRTIKNTDAENVKITELSLVDAAVNENDKTVTVNAYKAQKLFELSAKVDNEKLSAAFYTDAACTKAVTEYTLANADTDTLYIGVKAGETLVKTYTVSFALTQAPYFTEAWAEDEIKATAVALYPASKGTAAGTEVTVNWNGSAYTFIYGENVFGTTTELNTNFTGKAVQIILPAGNYASSVPNIYGSWELYGEDYDTNPNVIDGDNAYLSEEWGRYGETVIGNKTLSIAAEATPADGETANIVISGIRLARYLSDAARTVTTGKTVVTYKNIVYERSGLKNSSGNVLNSRTENTWSTAEGHVNNDEMYVYNFHYINTPDVNEATYSNPHTLFMDVDATAVGYMGGNVPAKVHLEGICIADATPAFGTFRYAPGCESTEFTLKNSFFKNITPDTSNLDYLISFIGHDEKTSSEARDAMTNILNIEGNTFIDCGFDSSGNHNNTVTNIIKIYPQSFSEINIEGNLAVSTLNKNYEFIGFESADYSVNEGDYSDKFTVKNNRIIGLMPSLYVNEDTELDLSENYFAKYTEDYADVALGDTPGDTDADVYLDYAMTVKKSQMAPAASTVLNGMTVDNEIASIYAYATPGTYRDLGFSGIGDYILYDSMSRDTQVHSVTVEAGKANHLYLFAAKDNVSVLYSLDIIGVSSLEDVENAVASEDAVYYPTLYGAPKGIKAVAYYDGVPYSFTTGENVVTSIPQFMFNAKPVIFPDHITEFTADLPKWVDIKSVNKDSFNVTFDNKTLKIGTVGDSITEGVSPRGATDYTYQNGLDDYFGGLFEVANHGKSSATANVISHIVGYERAYLVYAKTKYEASIAYNPDVVIFALGTNDTMCDRWRSNNYYYESYRDIINIYQSLETKPQIIITNTLERSDAMAQQMRVEHDLVYLQQKLAKELNAIIIDTNTYMAPYLYWDMENPGQGEYETEWGKYKYFYDGSLHPNNLGNKIMGTFIGEEMMKYIVDASKEEPKGWSFDSETGTLTVSEDLGDFAVKTAPWYEYANDVKAIAIEEGVTEIGAWAFNYCFNATSVSLPSTLKTIGTNAFYRCQSLTEVVIPESVDTIKSGAFSYCYELREVTIPKAVTTINSYTFYDCNKLTSAYYAGTAEQWNAITIKANNGNIANAYPPASEEVFEWSIADGVLTLSGNGYMPDYTAKTAPWFEKADEITKVVIEDGLKSVGTYAFAYLRNLKSVEIAESVTLIEKYSFYGSGIKEIVLPENVNVIGNGAFTYCGYLTSINIPDGVTEIKNYTFYGCNNLKTVDGDISDITIGVGNENLIK